MKKFDICEKTSMESKKSSKKSSKLSDTVSHKDVKSEKILSHPKKAVKSQDLTSEEKIQSLFQERDTLREQLVQSVETNIKLTKQVGMLTKNLEELRIKNNLCSAGHDCKNKAEAGYRYCPTHKCDFKDCIESKQYDNVGAVRNRYCSQHDHFWIWRR